MIKKDILLIQSYVAYGYVGNRAAMFPLQRLGFEVTAVNTVQFSNHTGYENFAGDVMTSDHLSRVLSGIEKRGIFKDFSAVLSGYLGSAELGELILQTVRKIKRENPSAYYCCDPVMGDAGVGMFIPAKVAEFIRQECVPLADILTPNLYELAYLAEQSVESLNSIKAIQAACNKLHQRGPRIILVTGIQMLLSFDKNLYVLETPKFDLKWPPSGSGDATSALFVGYLLKLNDPKKALEKTAASIFELFKATFEAGTRELQFIGAQELMIHPKHEFLAKKQ